MEWIIELLKAGASMAAGGGLLWLLNARKSVRRKANDLDGEDFRLVSETVLKSTQDLAILSDRIGELEKKGLLMYREISELKVENAALKEGIVELKEENLKLKRENAHLDKVLRNYITENNPGLKK